MPSLRIIKAALVATIFAFAIAGTYVSFLIFEQQALMREVSRYNVRWAASQALAEFHRFEYRVAASVLPDSTIGKDEVRLRFEILLNRLNILRGGDLADFTDRVPEQKAVVDELAAVLAVVEPLLDRLEQPGEVLAVLAHLAPLQAKLTRFAAAAHEFSGAQTADDLRTLGELYWLFSAVAAGLVLCGLVFIGLLLFQTNMIGRAHAELRTLTRDLERAKTAAESASEAKSRFLANISHELRTPLNAIIGFSELIANETFGKINPPKYRDYAHDIARSGTHMFELVSDILTMAKLDAGHFELTSEEIALAPVVNEIVGMFRGTEMAQGREIVVDFPERLPHIFADRRGVRQMVLNLLSNAVKFSDRSAPVRIGCTFAEGAVRLTVSDRGIGMTPQQAAIAVEPFQQVDSRMTRKYDGAGLGLSIVKGMIERHGGQLLIESEPGKGTRVTLVFPAALIRANLATAA